MKHILITIFIIFHSAYTYSSEYCESTLVFTPTAEELNNYIWSHHHDMDYSTYTYSSTDQNNYAEAVIYFCSRAMHHVGANIDKIRLGAMGRNEEWLYDEYLLSDEKCIENNESYCFSFTYIPLKYKHNDSEIYIEIQLRYETKTEKDLLFNWVESLNFTYNPNKALQPTAESGG